MAGEHPAPFVWQGANQLSAPIIWIGTTTTTAGVWSVDYAAAGFVSTPIVEAIPVLNSADSFDRAFASLSNPPSLTGAGGYAIRGANLLVLGPTVRTVPDGTVIHVMAIGETYTP